jgi:hypothetical protein
MAFALLCFCFAGTPFPVSNGFKVTPAIFRVPMILCYTFNFMIFTFVNVLCYNFNLSFVCSQFVIYRIPDSQLYTAGTILGFENYSPDFLLVQFQRVTN